ncbi:MAG: four helix bundle protein [Ferruginibacter sp.]|nr:four helix bundle protein [Ferruginibacter sp.]
MKFKSSCILQTLNFQPSTFKMASISKFEDLEIWQLARQQANELWKIYCNGSFAKDFELRNQISRSSGSVMDNIAEGFKRSANKEFINFLVISKASNGEVRSQLYRAFDRLHLSNDKFENLKLKCEMISKKTTSFIKYLKDSNLKGFRFS